MKWQYAAACVAVCIAWGEGNNAGGQQPSAGRHHIQSMLGTERMRRVQPRPVAPPPSWADIEQRLEERRKQRKHWHSDYSSVADFYALLASPNLTGSQTLEEHLKHLERWQKEMPDSSAARVVRAKALLHFAWEARGSGVAGTVTQEGWKLFAERSKEAHRLLDEAIELGVTDGEAYAQLVKVGYAEGHPREQVQAWVDAGLKLDPTYYAICDEMAVYLMPRWMGEPGDIEQFAGEVVRKIPGDDGLEAYARIAFTIQRYECGWGETLFRGEYDYPTLVRAAEVLHKRLPDYPRIAHFAALCSVVAQDHAAAQRIRPYVNDFNAEDKVWVWQNSLKHFYDWSAAAESPRGEESWVFAGLLGCPGISFANERRYMWVAQQFGTSAVNLMDVPTNHVELGLPHPGGVVNGFVFDPGRRWALLTAWRGPLTGWILWDLSETPRPVTHETKEMCRAIAIHPTRPLVFWAEGRLVHSWDIEADAAGPDIDVKQYPQDLHFSDDGSLLAVGNVICDTADGKPKYQLPVVANGQRPTIQIRKLLAIDDERRVWAIISSLKPDDPKMSLARFSVDGSTWEAMLDDIGWSSAWLSPDRKLLATVPPISNGPAVSRIEIWNIASRKRVKEFNGHWNSIQELAFSPDGSKLASVAMWADAVKIWPLDGLAD